MYQIFPENMIKTYLLCLQYYKNAVQCIAPNNNGTNAR